MKINKKPQNRRKACFRTTPRRSVLGIIAALACVAASLFVDGFPQRNRLSGLSDYLPKPLSFRVPTDAALVSHLRGLEYQWKKDNYPSKLREMLGEEVQKLDTELDKVECLGKHVVEVWLDKGETHGTFKGRRLAVSKLREVIRKHKIFRKSLLFAYGSGVTGLADKKSDLDICFIPSFENNSTDSESKEELCKRFAFQLRYHLRRFSPECMDVFAITRTKHPLVAFNLCNLKKERWIHCDMSILNPIAVINTHLLRSHAKLSTSAMLLMFYVRTWARYNYLSGGRYGFPSLYTWTLLAIHYLNVKHQTFPEPISPEDQFRLNVTSTFNENQTNLNCTSFDYIKNQTFFSAVGDLVSGFFQYYGGGEFNWTSHVVSINSTAKKKEIFANAPKWRPSVQDPLEITRDLNKYVNRDASERVLKAIRRVHQQITSYLTSNNTLSDEILLRSSGYERGVKERRNMKPEDNTTILFISGIKAESARRAREGLFELVSTFANVSYIWVLKMKKTDHNRGTHTAWVHVEDRMAANKTIDNLNGVFTKVDQQSSPSKLSIKIEDRRTAYDRTEKFDSLSNDDIDTRSERNETNCECGIKMEPRTEEWRANISSSDRRESICDQVRICICGRFKGTGIQGPSEQPSQWHRLISGSINPRSGAIDLIARFNGTSVEYRYIGQMHEHIDGKNGRMALTRLNSRFGKNYNFSHPKVYEFYRSPFKRKSLVQLEGGGNQGARVEEPAYLIVVEGEADRRAVERAVKDTNANHKVFSLSGAAKTQCPNIQVTLLEAAEGRLVCFLLDPDIAGLQSRLSGQKALGNCHHAFVSASKCTSLNDTLTHAKGNVGIEHSTSESIILALKAARPYYHYRAEISMKDLQGVGVSVQKKYVSSDGLSYAKSLSLLRKIISLELGIGPILSAKKFVVAINRFGFTLDDVALARENAIKSQHWKERDNEGRVTHHDMNRVRENLERLNSHRLKKKMESKRQLLERLQLML